MALQRRDGCAQWIRAALRHIFQCPVANLMSAVSEWRGRFERRWNGRRPGAGHELVAMWWRICCVWQDRGFELWVKDVSVSESEDKAFMFLTGH